MRQTPQSGPLGVTIAAAALCAAVTQPATAQVPAGPPGAYPAYTPVVPGNVPPAQHPWPAISPFAAPYQTIQNDGGLWFQDTRFFGRKKYAKISALRGQFREPSNASIGALPDFEFLFPPNLGRIDEDGEFDPDGDVPTRVIAGLSPVPSEPVGFLALTPLVFTFGESNDPAADFRSEVLNDIGASVDFLGGEDDGDDNSIDEDIEGAGFKPITAAIFGEDDDDIPLGRFNFDGSDDFAEQVRDVTQGGTGIKLVFGFEDPDETGFEIEGSWLDGEESIFRRGLNSDPQLILPNEDPTDPITQFAILNRQLLQLPNLRIAGLIALEAPQTTALTGVQTFQLLNYDLFFQVAHETETAGTSLAYYFTPVVKKKHYRIRPQASFGYHFIQERFGFVGQSSGLLTTFEDSGTLIDFETEAGDDGDVDGITVVAPYTSALNSTVRSHLFGPTVGAGMDIGGENFLLSGFARAGLAANIETVELDGFGLGFGQANAFGTTIEDPDGGDDIEVAGTFDRQEFSEEQTFSHVSPTFEFHAEANAPLLRFVPGINKIAVFDQARFTLGFDFFAAYEVARPVDQIRWVSSDEGGPFIESSRDLFWYLDWTFGVRWDW